MNIGNQVLNIRKENQLTQEEFGKLFHVTRQTVSNWGNGKSYPELQILVSISNQFDISLDTLLKPTNKKSSLVLKDLQAERKVAQKDRHSGGRVRKDICRVIQ